MTLCVRSMSWAKSSCSSGSRVRSRMVIIKSSLCRRTKCLRKYLTVETFSCWTPDGSLFERLENSRITELPRCCSTRGCTVLLMPFRFRSHRGEGLLFQLSRHLTMKVTWIRRRWWFWLDVRILKFRSLCVDVLDLSVHSIPNLIRVRLQ